MEDKQEVMGVAETPIASEPHLTKRPRRPKKPKKSQGRPKAGSKNRPIERSTAGKKQTARKGKKPSGGTRGPKSKGQARPAGRPM